MRKTFSWSWFIFKLWIFGSRFREITITPLTIKNNIVLKTLSIKDIHHVIDLTHLHAQKGHYRFPDINTDERVLDGLKVQIAQSIYLQRMQFAAGVSRSYVVSAYAGEEPVAFCWMRSIPESEHTAWEIYMISVHPSYQQEGIAEQLSLFCIDQLPANTPVIARVFKNPSSLGIRKLLKK